MAVADELLLKPLCQNCIAESLVAPPHAGNRFYRQPELV